MRKHDRLLLPPLTAPALKPVHTRHREDPAHPDANTCTCWRWASLPDVTEGCEGTALQKTQAREQCTCILLASKTTNLRTGDVKEAGPTQALHDVRCLYFFLLAAAAAAAAALAFLSDSSASE